MVLLESAAQPCVADIRHLWAFARGCSHYPRTTVLSPGCEAHHRSGLHAAEGPEEQGFFPWSRRCLGQSFAGPCENDHHECCGWWWPFWTVCPGCSSGPGFAQCQHDFPRPMPPLPRCDESHLGASEWALLWLARDFHYWREEREPDAEETWLWFFLFSGFLTETSFTRRVFSVTTWYDLNSLGKCAVLVLQMFRNSSKYSSMFKDAQVEEEHASFWKAIRNLSFAGQRFDSLTSPLFKIFTVFPGMIRFLCNMTRVGDAEDQRWAKRILEALSAPAGGQNLIKAAMVADCMLMVQSFLRLDDRSDTSVMIKAREAMSFKGQAVVVCFWTKDWTPKIKTIPARSTKPSMILESCSWRMASWQQLQKTLWLGRRSNSRTSWARLCFGILGGQCPAFSPTPTLKSYGNMGKPFLDWWTSLRRHIFQPSNTSMLLLPLTWKQISHGRIGGNLFSRWPFKKG